MLQSTVRATMGKVHELAAKGDIAGVQAALSAGAAVEACDSEDRTVLHVAAAAGATDLVKYLVEERDADVDAEDGEGKCPLHLAAEAGHLDTVKVLLGKSDEDAEDGDGNTPVWLALSNGHLEVAETLLDEGADPSLQCEGGATYLHVAAQQGTAAVQLLLDRGAKVDALDGERNTPLMKALQAGSWAAAKQLIQAGADVKALGKNAWTPLHYCAQNLSGKPGAIDIAELLVEKGASAKPRTRDGMTPAAVVGLDCKRGRKAAEADEDMQSYLADVEEQEQE